MELLIRYDWPGNVRELQNSIYSVMAVFEGDRVEPDVLPERIRDGRAGTTDKSVSFGSSPLAQIVTQATEQAEKAAIQDAIAKTGGNREKAAETLGVGRATLYRKLRQYGME
jgi:DNA-binding NtrC family response regulator